MNIRKMLSICMLLAMLFSAMGAGPRSALAQSVNLALNKPATASSVESGTTLTADKAVDGSTTTRWGSVDPATTAQWIYVDLGASTAISRVVLRWEAAYAKAYQVQVSDDASTWTTVFSTTTGDGATDDLTGLTGNGRYVRVYCTTRGTSYGYSLWEFDRHCDCNDDADGYPYGSDLDCHPDPHGHGDCADPDAHADEHPAGRHLYAHAHADLHCDSYPTHKFQPGAEQTGHGFIHRSRRSRGRQGRGWQRHHALGQR